MKSTISLPLDIPDVKVLQTKVNRAGDIVITVESTLKGTKCRQCGRKIDKSHGHDDWIELQHLPILRRRSYIQLRPKRYRCLNCDNKPTTTQQLDWYQLRCSTTKAFEAHMMLQLVNSTIEDVPNVRLFLDPYLGEYRPRASFIPDTGRVYFSDLLQILS